MHIVKANVDILAGSHFSGFI